MVATSLKAANRGEAGWPVRNYVTNQAALYADRLRRYISAGSESFEREEQMKHRFLAAIGALACLTVSSGMSPAAAQKPDVRKAAASRTPWGDPDLQGTWTSEGELGIPFERAPEFGN